MRLSHRIPHPPCTALATHQPGKHGGCQVARQQAALYLHPVAPFRSTPSAQPSVSHILTPRHPQPPAHGGNERTARCQCTPLLHGCASIPSFRCRMSIRPAPNCFFSSRGSPMRARLQRRRWLGAASAGALLHAVCHTAPRAWAAHRVAVSPRGSKSPPGCALAAVLRYVVQGVVLYAWLCVV